MKLLILISILCILEFHYAQGSSRIIGGVTVSNRKYFVHQASIQNGGVHFCGGTIVNKRHVLTAAWCTEVIGDDQLAKAIPLEDLTVVVGNLKLHDDPDALTKKVDYIFVHEKYDRASRDNNVAVIRLTEELTESTTVGFISLADHTPPQGTNAFVSGWGTFTEDEPGPNEKLRAVSIPVVDQMTCNDVFRQLTNRMFCAGARKMGFCDGDIGGPLVCQGPTLCGMASYTQTNCVSATDILGVYLDVSKYVDWTSEQFTKEKPSSHDHDVSSKPVISLSIIICIVLFIFLC